MTRLSKPVICTCQPMPTIGSQSQLSPWLKQRPTHLTGCRKCSVVT